MSANLVYLQNCLAAQPTAQCHETLQTIGQPLECMQLYGILQEACTCCTQMDAGTLKNVPPRLKEMSGRLGICRQGTRQMPDSSM